MKRQIDGECNGEYEVERTWLMQDCSGNQVEYVQSIFIIDDQLPVFALAPEDQINQCEEQPYFYEAFDNCNDVEITETREVLFEDSCGNYEHLVTLSASDLCGNVTDTTFTIIVQDTIEPEWITEEFPQDMTVSCDDLPSAPAFEAMDNCAGLIEAAFVEEVVNTDCPGQSVIVRTWIASDCTGNSISHVQTLTVEDDEAPGFVGDLPVDLVVECDAIPDPILLVANDNCDDEVAVIFTEEVDGVDCPQSYIITRTWTVEDCAGNGNMHVQTIEVQDTTAPVFTDVPSDQNNQCEEAPYTSAASDNCGAVAITESREVISDDACGNYEHLVTLTATDECGNSSDHQFTIVVQDTEAPVFVEALPSDETVECDAIPDPVAVSATDNCTEEVEVVFTETITDGACPQSYTITRTWAVTDCSGNGSFALQTIEVEDSTAPVFTDVPSDQDNQCEEAPYTSAASDNCSEVVISESREVMSEDSCGNYEHLVTLTATDECGNSVDYQFTITVQDTEEPTFVEGLPQDIGMTCFEAASEAEVLTAIDNCDVSVEVVFNQDSIPGDCPGTYTLLRNWTSIDCSGNEATHEQVVEVSDTEQPELIGLVCPEDATIFLDENCEVDISPEALGMPSVSAIDNCSEAAVVIEFEDAIDPQCGEAYNFTRTFSIYAVDACGLVSEVATCNQFIQVQDILSPTFTNAPEDLIFECEEEAFAVEAVDGCTAVSIDESREVISEDECGNYVHLVTLTASDDCGNVVSHIFTITVEDTESPIWDQAMPGDLNISCGELEDAGLYTATDACDGAVDVDFAEEIIGEAGCAAGFTVIRTWTATDCTGNESVVTQEIVVSDSGAPEWSMEIPSDVTVECSAVPVPPILTAVDNCDDNVEVVLTEEIVEGPCPSRYTLIRTWTATDDCGNFIEGSQTLIVVDTTAPIWIGSLPAVDLTVTCLNIPEPPVLTGDNPELIAFDNCDGETAICFNEYWSGSPCDGGGVIFRSWIAIDCIGNLATLTQTILVVD